MFPRHLVQKWRAGLNICMHSGPHVVLWKTTSKAEVGEVNFII